MNDLSDFELALSRDKRGEVAVADNTLRLVQQRVAARMRPAFGHYVECTALDAVEGGKLVRPRLLIAAAGGDSDCDAVVQAAAAMELIHAALLVHDDLIDGDAERRGRKTVAQAASDRAMRAGLSVGHRDRVGMTTAVVAGDILLTRGLSELARLQVPDSTRHQIIDAVDRALSAAAMGEFDDAWHANSSLDEAFIRTLLERKTADYSFRAPLEVGALLGQRSAEVVQQLGSIGLRMGVLYQLRDDLLGTFGDEQTTGKSVMSDLRTGAPTMLVHLATVTPEWSSIAELWGDPDSGSEALAKVRDAFTTSGALVQLQERMEHERMLLRTDIAELDIEQEVRDELGRMLLKTVERLR